MATIPNSQPAVPNPQPAVPNPQPAVPNPQPAISTSQPAITDKMATITVIGNPLAKEHDKVLLFQNSNVNGLCVSSRSIVDLQIRDIIGPVDADAIHRPLASPSQLVSMIYKDTVAVYGIIGKEVKDLQLSMLSPVQDPIIDVTPITGSLAGCAQPDGELAWLYMIYESDKGEAKIGEWELSSTSVALRQLDCKDFSNETKLYAVFDEVDKKRWLIFQTTGKDLVIFDAGGNKGWPIDKSASRVIAKTPLAAAIVPAIGNKSRRIVVYFIGSETQEKKILCRAFTDLVKDNLSFSRVEQQPQPLPGNPELLDWTQIAAYVDVPSQRTLIFGVETMSKKKQPVFNLEKHEWAALDTV